MRPCPGCRGAHLWQPVPDVHASGKWVVGYVNGPKGVKMSPLSRALIPPSEPDPNWAGLGCGACLTIPFWWLGAGFVVTFGFPQLPPEVEALVMLAPVLVAVAIGLRRTYVQSKTGPVIRRARAVWERLLYCWGCDISYHPRTGEWCYAGDTFGFLFRAQP